MLGDVRNGAAVALLACAALTTASASDRPVIVDKRVGVEGRQIRYLESGSGSAVVLVHGFGADVRAWRAVLPELATDFHVYALDQLGFGQSDKPEIAYTVSTLAESLAGFISTLNIHQPVIVGHSLGGWVAARYALAHPDGIAKLVLVDAAGYGEDPSELIRDYAAQWDPAALAAAERFLAGMSPEERKQTEALIAAMIAQRLARRDGYAIASLGQSILQGDDVLGPEVHGIKAPTLVVWGRQDQIVPLRVGDALAQAIPGAKEVVLDGCGHRVPNECAAPFTAAVRDFLRN